MHMFDRLRPIHNEQKRKQKYRLKFVVCVFLALSAHLLNVNEPSDVDLSDNI